MSPYTLLLSTLATLVTVAPAGAQDTGLEALEAAAERYASIRTICADFVQVLDNPLLGSEKTSRGRLCQQRPNRFRMDFAEPDGDEVVADGTWFWVYYKSLDEGQVLRFPLDPSRGGLDFFREFLSEPAAKYTVTTEGEDTVDGHATLRLALAPRSSRGLESARVWVDPAARLIRRIEVTEDNGLTRRVSLSSVALDPTLDGDHFEFTVPPGVDVVSNE